MVNRRRVRYWLSLILPLVLATVLMVGCDAADQEGGGGGLLDDQTALVDPTMVVDETPLVDDDGLDDDLGATPEITDTITDTEEMTDTTGTEPTAEPTEVITATAEPTVEVTEDATTDVTPETGAQTEGAMVIRGSELVGMSLMDDAGDEVGIVDELLADESGAIQYVIVEALVTDDVDDATDDADVTDDTATDDTDTDDTAADDTLQDDPDMVVDNRVALTWDAVEVVSGTMSADDDVLGDDQLNLVYSGATPLQDETSFDATILDEEGSILDDQMTGDDDVSIPPEYVDLIQIGEFGDFNLTNPNGDDLGEIEDVLIDVNEGRVAYAIVDVGGFLGIAEKQVAVPWEAFQIDVTVDGDAEEESFMLDTTEEELENAPGLDLDDWDPNVDVDWDADLQGFWQARDVDVDIETDTDE